MAAIGLNNGLCCQQRAYGGLLILESCRATVRQRGLDIATVDEVTFECEQGADAVAAGVVHEHRLGLRSGRRAVAVRRPG